MSDIKSHTVAFNSDLVVLEAKAQHKKLIENMAQFYFYELAQESVYFHQNNRLGSSGLYESIIFNSYFEDPSRHAYLLFVNQAVVGFVLINKATQDIKNEWHIAEFFILGQYQRQGLGYQLLLSVLARHQGWWEVSVLPDHHKAIMFWEKTLAKLTQHQCQKTTKMVSYDKTCPQRVIFEFNTEQITSVL